MTNAISVEAFLKTLDYQTFEYLAGLLLVRHSFNITRTPTSNVRESFDFEAIDPRGRNVVIEVMHFKRTRKLTSQTLAQFLGELGRHRQQHPQAYGLLITSNLLTDVATDMITDSHFNVWDLDKLTEMLSENPDVVRVVVATQKSKDDVTTSLAALKSSKVVPSPSAAVADELKALPAGNAHWRDYEKLGTRILTDIFSPHLAAPELQTRSEDGLDIMDAIFPVRGIAPPWSVLRSEHRSRFVVAEFKNYAEPIGQRQVESLAQYLWHKAFRSFGLLLSRNGFTESAALARRRAWTDGDRMIVMLSDDDLVYMAQLKEEGQDAFQVVDSQLETFFSRLSP